MMEDLEQGDVAATIKQFFETSKHCLPLSKSTLSLQEVSLYVLDKNQLLLKQIL